jgi:PAS domain S-box-containing protein
VFLFKTGIAEQRAIFLGSEYNHICRIIGVNKHPAVNNNESPGEKHDWESDHSFMQHFPGIKFQLEEDFKLRSLSGPVDEITGYSKEEILSGKVDWMEMVAPEDQLLIFEKRAKLKSNPNVVLENEFRICRKNGETKWVREITQKVSDISDTSVKFQGLIYDITERKKAEEALEKINKLRIKEIHHRIKNNLQVISSLLSLQAEKFEDKEVLEAFKESQSRIASIAMIHEELHEGEGMDTLDFSDYLRKLTAELFSSYRVGNNKISLKLDLEQVYLNMDTAIPLGIIVNEVISNALKYAFPAGRDGEIYIKFCGIETFNARYDVSGLDGECLNKNDLRYILIVADNGKGFPKKLTLELRNPLDSSL